MNVEHEILQVGVHTCLVIDSGLLIGEEVVELDDSNRNSFIFLSLHHLMFEHRVLDDLEGYYRRELSSLCHVPPVITVQGGI